MNWRECAEFPYRYVVSEYGDIRIIYAERPYLIGKILRPRLSNSGYLYVPLGPGKGRSNYFIHRLVARAFHGEPPAGLYWVAHNDGNRLNNHCQNLRWATPAENHADKKLHGTHLAGEKIGNSKLSLEDVSAIRDLWETNTLSQKAIGARFSIAQATVCKVIHGLRWSESFKKRAGVECSD